MRKHKDTLANILLTITVFLAVVWVYNYRHDLPSEQPAEDKVTAEEKTYPQSEEEYLSNFGGPPEDVIKELYGLEDGKLRNLSSTLCGVRVGNPTETVFSIRVYKENDSDCVELFKNDELYGEMYDDATHGDKNAGDCIYSLTVPIESKDIDDRFDFYVKCGDRISDTVTIYTFSEWTKEQEEKENQLCSYIGDVLDSCCDETGYVPYQQISKTVDKLYDSIVNYCELNNVEILQIEKSADNVSFTFKSGLPILVQIPQADVGASSNAPVSIVTVEPCISGPSSLVSFENQASYIDIALGSSAYYQKQYEDENVNVENITEAFGPNRIIIWHGHGCFDYPNGVHLLTGILVTEGFQEKYQKYFDEKALIFSETKTHVFITSKFVELHIDDMSNTFVYLGACHSVEDSRLADAMIAKGATVVQGFTNTVYASYDTAVINSMSHELCKFDPDTELYQNFETALANTIQNCEDNDVDYAKKYTNKKEFKDTTAFLAYYGDPSYYIPEYIEVDEENNEADAENISEDLFSIFKNYLSQKFDQFLSSIWDRISEFLQKIVYELKVFWYGEKAMGVS